MRESALSKVNADESASCPELVAKTTRPPVRLDTYWSVVDAVLAYRLAAVNAVDDAYGNVLEPVAVLVTAPEMPSVLESVAAPATASVPVAVKLPPKNVLPATSRRLVGEVVPMPKLPESVRRARSSRPLLVKTRSGDALCVAPRKYVPSPET